MGALSRRSVLKLVLPAALIPRSLCGQISSLAGSTFVLVHGAWHGGWCWRKVVPLLRDRGHDVFTPTLTGLGERTHLAAAEIDLDLHVQDIVAVLEYEDLRDVVLVGHSYGGMVITGVASGAAGRIRHLVYLDALLPEDGRALADYTPIPAAREDGWRIPPIGSPTARFGVTDTADLSWINERMSDQPLRTFTQPARLPGDGHRSIPGTYIQVGESGVFAEAGARARQMGYAHVTMFRAGHDVMVTKPMELAEVLLGLN